MTSAMTMDDRSVSQIDDELRACSTELDATADVARAGVLAERLQGLRLARPIAAARARAQVRHQQGEEARAARDVVARVEAEVAPQLRADAAAFDRWVAEGRRLRAQFDATGAQFHALLRAVDAPAGRELHLPQLLHRLTAIDAPLETCLAGAGVLRHVALPAGIRAPGPTLESQVVRQTQRALHDAQEWVPVAPDDEPSR